MFSGVFSGLLLQTDYSIISSLYETIRWAEWNIFVATVVLYDKMWRKTEGYI